MIELIKFTGENDHPFGNIQGKAVLNKLLHFIDALPHKKIFEISLKGIIATDASFPRESIITLVKQFRAEKWFYITHFNSDDLIDNWDYAAKAKDIPITVLKANGEVQVIGPTQNSATQDLFLCVFNKESVSTAEVAKELNISVQNASTRLKKLATEGLIFRTEETATTGGIEYKYHPVKESD